MPIHHSLTLLVEGTCVGVCYCGAALFYGPEPFKVERYFALHEFTTKRLLCVSDCEAHSVRDIFQLADPSNDGHIWQQFGDLRLGYTESLGSPSLRSAIASNVLGGKFGQDDLLMHMGQGALFHSGDHVIVQTPCYPSQINLPRYFGIDVTELDFGSKGEISLDLLEESITPRTRGIVITNPANPTGALMMPDDLHAVLQVAREHSLTVLSDEAYRYLEHRPEQRLPCAAELYENVVSLSVFSKAVGLPGLRVGWMVSRNSDLLNRMASMKDYTSICLSAPSEFIAEIAANHWQHLARQSVEVPRLLTHVLVLAFKVDPAWQLINDNLCRVDAFMEKHANLFRWKRPTAGPIGLVELVQPSASSTQFCEVVRKESGVLLLPSDCFNYGDKHFRIGFGRRGTKDAVDALDRFLSGH